jgi:hypothetical protein
MNLLSSTNYALSFDGVNDLVRANQVVGVGPLTIEAWVRPTTSNANGLVIVGADDNTGWSLELNDGRLTLWLATNQGWQFNQNSMVLQAGQWYHIVATYEAGYAQTFVDGVASGATSVGTLTQGPHLRFGGFSSSYAYFAGDLDEVRISNMTRYGGNFTPPTAPFVSDANTLGLWHFDEASGQTANDASTSANHGTLGTTSGSDSADPGWTNGYPFAGEPATPTPTSTPMSGNPGLSFDGVNDIVRANQVVGTGPLTIEAWVRPAASNADDLIVVGADEYTGWCLELDGGYLTLWLATNQGWQSNQHPTPLVAGQWYHIAATYGNGSARTFVNGVASTATSVGTLTQGPFLRLGGLSDSFGYFFAGVLDEVRISNIIRYTANFTPPIAPFTPDANTRGLWHLNEGTGQLANDSSALANHGTLGNSSGVDSADPTWVVGYPFAGTPTPTPTRTNTLTATPTNTPTNTPTPTPTPTVPPNSYQLIDAALARGEITRDQAALYKVYALFGARSEIPTQFISTEPVPGDGTMLFLEALKDWDSLTPATQNLINDFITPKEITTTVTAGASSARSTQSTVVATPTPQKFSPGIHRIIGAVQSVGTNRLQVKLSGQVIDVAIRSNTTLVLGKQQTTLSQWQAGDRVEGFIRVDAQGQITALNLRAQRLTKSTTSRASTQSAQTATTETNTWSEPQNLASGQGSSTIPALAIDENGNMVAVWYNGSSLWYAYWRTDTRQWSAPQAIAGTQNAWRGVGLTVVQDGGLRLVWRETQANSQSIFYARATWLGNGGTGFAWTTPVPIYQVTSDAMVERWLGEPTIVATFDPPVRMHLAWDEYTYNYATESWSYALKYLAGDNVTWQTTPVTLASDSIATAQPQLATDRAGRVGLVYRYVDTNYNAFVHYRECTATDCSPIQNWSAASVLPTVSASSYLEFPHLAFDTGRKVHVTWTSSVTNGWEIYYATRTSSSVPWNTPARLGASDFAIERPAPNAMVAAGTPNNVYIAWNRYLLDADGYVTGMELEYNRWNGQGWAGAATPPRQSGLLSWAGERWGALGVDKNNVLQMVWNGAGGEVWYASKWQIGVDIGRCRLTEYYDTPEGNFRIYYTRTYPNVLTINPNTGALEPWDADCRLIAPDRNINTPLPINPNGYPEFVVILGASLEQSRSHYSAQMGYPLNGIPLQDGRYTIFISSDPIWTDMPLPFVNPVPRLAIALPERIFFNRGNQYNPSQPLDTLRVTSAHEFFHAVQWTYVPNAPISGQGGTWVTNQELRWWMEATAQWAQQKVYAQDGTYPVDLDALLREPYRSLAAPDSLISDPRWYGSFIFATFLQQKVANSEAIVRQTWERYRANNGGSMLTAIEQVLQNQYATNLTNEFPKFTWHNYFMNAGTYDIQVTNVYTNLETLQPAFTGPQWQLFRSHLREGRDNWQVGNAGVAIIDQVVQFPVNGPPTGKPDAIASLGAAYLEFYPTNLSPGITADLNIAITIPSGAMLPIEDRPRVSVMAIASFGATPHPSNDFIQPTTHVGSLDLRYNRLVTNFKSLDRVVVIISNISPTVGNVPYRYSANIVIR